MIAVDTNLLLRLLVNDDAAQAIKARRLFDDMAGEDGSIWVSDMVLVEIVWTLARAYQRPRLELVAVLRALTCHATIALESTAAVRAAIATFESGPADFADCLLAEKARLRGCDRLVTFDKGMRGLPGVKLL